MPLLAHSPSRNQYAPKSFGEKSIVHEEALVKGWVDDEVALDWRLWKC